MRSSVPVRRTASGVGWATEKHSANDCDILPRTIQPHQKQSPRRKKGRRRCLSFSRFFSRGGRRTQLQLDDRRGRVGTTYISRRGVFQALMILSTMLTLYMFLEWWFVWTQTHQDSVRVTFRSQLSRPIALVFPTCQGQRRSKFYLPLPMDPDSQEEAGYVDYDGLFIQVFEEESQHRSIFHDFYEDMGMGEIVDEADEEDDNDYYYAFDDDVKRNPYIAWDDPNIQDEKHCRRVSWHRLVLLNCNSFHELSLASNALDGSVTFKGAGTYREVFSADQPLLDETETIVFKEFVYSSAYGHADYEFMRMDALVSERFTSSPLIVDIYGYCGLSMMSEYMPLGDLRNHVMPNSARSVKVELDDSEPVDPWNSFSGTEKLTLSLLMAEAIALLHGYKGGVIVHDDIQLSQFLATKDGGLKLNDFNRAEIMLWDEEDQEYCRYRNNPGYGDWRAPEEYVDKPLNEKIDVWSLGLNMYALLTGLTPYYNVLTEKEVQVKINNGEKPFIDPRYRSRSFAEGKLVEIMELCLAFEPDDRPEMFEIARRLREANGLNQQRLAENGETDASPISEIDSTN